MFYRIAGQFKTNYASDQALFPVRMDDDDQIFQRERLAGGREDPRHEAARQRQVSWPGLLGAFEPQYLVIEARGLVERRPDPDDRRVWLVAITDAGRSVAGQVNDVDEVLRAELRHGIGREERQALAWVMQRLQQNLQSAIHRSVGAADRAGDPPSTTTPGDPQ